MYHGWYGVILRFPFVVSLTAPAFRNIQIVHIFRNTVEVIPMFSFSRKGTFGKIMPKDNEKKYSQNVQRVRHKLNSANIRRQQAGTC